jgi:hypothetical protein
MSMQAIREWLRAHPDQRPRVLQHNESYVFFRPLPGAPEGSLGRPLTPGRSVATDARLFPPAGLAFIETERPERASDGSVRWTPLRRFVLNQDTGDAGTRPPSPPDSCGSRAGSTSWCRERRPSPRRSRLGGRDPPGGLPDLLAIQLHRRRAERAGSAGVVASDTTSDVS